MNSNLGNKLQWNLKQNSYIFIQGNAFKSVVSKMAATLSRPQCVKDHLLYDPMQCRYNPVIFFKSTHSRVYPQGRDVGWYFVSSVSDLGTSLSLQCFMGCPNIMNRVITAPDCMSLHTTLRKKNTSISTWVSWKGLCKQSISKVYNHMSWGVSKVDILHIKYDQRRCNTHDHAKLSSKQNPIVPLGIPLAHVKFVMCLYQ